MSLYDKYFPTKRNIRLKEKDMENSWITAGIKKSCKCKKHLYEIFLKPRTQKSRGENKHYSCFSKLKNKHEHANI